MANTRVVVTDDGDVGARATRLVDSAFTFDSAHVFRIGGPGKPRLPLGDEPLDASLIADWRAPLSCGNYNVETGVCSGQIVE